MKAARQTGTSRADEVRKRRLQNSQKKARQVTHVRYAAETPQVFVRGGYGTPVINRAQNRARRKVGIGSGKTFAASLLRALPILNIGGRLLSGIMVLVLGAMVYMVSTAAEFRVTAPEISGLQRINPADIEAVVGIHNVPIFMVDPAQIQTDLEKAFPELTNLSVEIALPAQLKIAAEERQPVLSWQYGDQISWVDAEGVIFPARGELSTPLLTVQAEDAPPTTAVEAAEADSENSEEATDEQQEVTAEPVKQYLDPTVLNAALQLHSLLQSDEVLEYSPSNGFGWNDPQGWKVFVGATLDNLEAKLQVYQALVERLNQQGIHPSLISVEFLHAPFYRLE